MHSTSFDYTHVSMEDSSPDREIGFSSLTKDKENTVRGFLKSTAGEDAAQQLLEEGMVWASESISLVSRAHTKHRSHAVALDDLKGMQDSPQSKGPDNVEITAWMLKCQKMSEEVNHLRKRLLHKESKLDACKKENCEIRHLLDDALQARREFQNESAEVFRWNQQLHLQSESMTKQIQSQLNRFAALLERRIRKQRLSSMFVRWRHESEALTSHHVGLHQLLRNRAINCGRAVLRQWFERSRLRLHLSESSRLLQSRRAQRHLTANFRAWSLQLFLSMQVRTCLERSFRHIFQTQWLGSALLRWSKLSLRRRMRARLLPRIFSAWCTFVKRCAVLYQLQIWFTNRWVGVLLKSVLDHWDVAIRCRGRWRKKIEAAFRACRVSRLRRAFSAWCWCALRSKVDLHYHILVDQLLAARKTRVLNSIMRLLSLKVTQQQHIRARWAQLSLAVHSRPIQQSHSMRFQLESVKSMIRKKYFSKAEQLLAKRCKSARLGAVIRVWNRMAERGKALWSAESRLQCRVELSLCADAWQAFVDTVEDKWQAQAADKFRNKQKRRDLVRSLRSWRANSDTEREQQRRLSTVQQETWWRLVPRAWSAWLRVRVEASEHCRLAERTRRWHARRCKADALAQWCLACSDRLHEVADGARAVELRKLRLSSDTVVGALSRRLALTRSISRWRRAATACQHKRGLEYVRGLCRKVMSLKEHVLQWREWARRSSYLRRALKGTSATREERLLAHCCGHWWAVADFVARTGLTV